MHRSNNYFAWNTCNTICDRTGLKVKLDDTITTWNGSRVIKSEAEPRPAGDFPVIPKPARTFEDSRFRQPDRDRNGDPVSLAPPPFVGDSRL